MACRGAARRGAARAPPRALSAARGVILLIGRGGADLKVAAFDQPVTAFEVRVNSTSHLDGEPADSWEGAPATEGIAEVPASALREGPNLVSIYGRSLRGIWTA